METFCLREPRDGWKKGLKQERPPGSVREVGKQGVNVAREGKEKDGRARLWDGGGKNGRTKVITALKSSRLSPRDAWSGSSL